jgi:PAS domain-containing protein
MILWHVYPNSIYNGFTTKSPDKEQAKIIRDSIDDGVFTVDSNWKITSFNQAAEKITGKKNSTLIPILSFCGHQIIIFDPTPSFYISNKDTHGY